MSIKIKTKFTRYETFLVAIIAIIQFTVILDFMVMAPLGAKLLHELNISPSQFGLVVSAYAFSAGISGFLAAGFADKFDRKKFLLFFYVGFIIGTFFCGISPNYSFLLIARIVTGLFGGVISGISFTIITDVFKLEDRGKVMGFVQMGFASSQILGIPIGLFLANKYGWHSPFIMIVAFAVLVGVIILKWMKPIDTHISMNIKGNAFAKFMNIFKQKDNLKAFGTISLLAIGGFILMPFSSAFLVNNVGVTEVELPLIFLCVGVFTLISAPTVGLLSDKVGKFKVFWIGSIFAIIMIIIYSHLGYTAFWLVVLTNILLFIAITSRMISAQALITAVPHPEDRGAFMSIMGSIQQLAGGIASVIAGKIIVQQTTQGPLLHYDTLGYISSLLILVCIVLMYSIHKIIEAKENKADGSPSVIKN